MRINNLEYRKATYLGQEPENPSWDIILWYPNYYYGRENEYIRKDDYYYPSEDPHHHIHKSCFRSPEHCIVIASFVYDNGFYEVHFCGDRPLDKDFDRDSFWKLLQYGNLNLNYTDKE